VTLLKVECGVQACIRWVSLLSFPPIVPMAQDWRARNNRPGPGRQAAWALTALGQLLPIEQSPPLSSGVNLQRLVNETPSPNSLAACSDADPENRALILDRLLLQLPFTRNARKLMRRGGFGTFGDGQRILRVSLQPLAAHQDPAPSGRRCILTGGFPADRASIPVRDGAVACFCCSGSTAA